MNEHGVRLTEARDGAPTRAVCSCGWVWEQPAGDPHSDTLPGATREHLRAVL